MWMIFQPMFYVYTIHQAFYPSDLHLYFLHSYYRSRTNWLLFISSVEVFSGASLISTIFFLKINLSCIHPSSTLTFFLCLCVPSILLFFFRLIILFNTSSSSWYVHTRQIFFLHDSCYFLNFCNEDISEVVVSDSNFITESRLVCGPRLLHLGWVKEIV